jgi:hypothetical protein
MFTSIAAGSSKTYRIGWESWLGYFEQENIDPLLHTALADYHKAPRAFTFEVAAITAYMLWAFLKKGAEGTNGFHHRQLYVWNSISSKMHGKSL